MAHKRKHKRTGSEANEDAVYISRAQVCARYGGRSRMWLERILRDDPTFPRPIYLRKNRYWKFADVIAWERKAAADRAA